VIIEGKVVSKEYIDIGEITFSPNGERVAYTAQKGNKKWVVVIDGVESSEFDDIPRDFSLFEGVDRNIIFSPDSTRVMYKVKKGGKTVAVIDEVESQGYNSIIWLTFTPDSKKAIFTGFKGDNKIVVVIDGKETREYDRIERPTFSPDGKSVKFKAHIPGGKWVKVVDGIEI
jgi:Tol biopolymer transport system component